MGNHFHFLIKPAEGTSLSKILQWIKCGFARLWNKMHGRTGHFWGDRFFSRIIGDRTDFEAVDKYISENAVKAGLVEKAEDWSFGGLFYRIKGWFGLIDRLPDPDTLFPLPHRLYADVS
jgi:putative transposase